MAEGNARKNQRNEVKALASKAAGWLERRAENVMAGLLGLMFAAFLVQIVFRYFFSFPVGWRARRVMGILAAVALVVLYGVSFPATWSYVTFMKVERSSYLHVRLDWMYSIYLLFMVALIVRYLRLLWRLVQGKDR